MVSVVDGKHDTHSPSLLSFVSRPMQLLALRSALPSLVMFVMTGMLLFAPAGVAQSAGSQTKGAPAKSAPSQRVTVAPTFSTLSDADRTIDRTLVQLRRFRQGSGLVTIREQLVVDSNGIDIVGHQLSFVGVEGELPGSPVYQKWQQTYGLLAEQFYQQGCFRVRDVASAQANYTLYDFGASNRAGRPTRSTVVFPSSTDKSIWLVDVDVATGLVLHCLEFDSNLNVLSEVEVLSVALAAQPQAAAPVTTAGSFAAAVAALGNPAGLIEPVTTMVGEYTLSRVETRVDPWNGQPKVVLTYSDGIDQFTVSEKPGALDPFAGLPGSEPGTGTIGRYRDRAMSALMFWDDGVAFEVVGSGGLQRLDGVAKSLYAAALAQ